MFILVLQVILSNLTNARKERALEPKGKVLSITIRRKPRLPFWNDTRTFGSLSNLDKLLEKLQEVTEELEKDMAKRGWAGKTVTLKYKLDTFKGTITF